LRAGGRKGRYVCNFENLALGPITFPDHAEVRPHNGAMRQKRL